MKSTRSVPSSGTKPAVNPEGTEATDAAAASDPGPPASPSEVAAYIAEMTESLANMARRSDLEALTYLLQVANAEADSQAQAKHGKGRSL